MARTPHQGTAHQGNPAAWTLTQLAAEAQMARGMARSVAARGYLSPGDYTETDVVLLRVGAACLDLPDPGEPPAPKHAADRPGRRDTLALRLVRGILADPATTTETTLLLSGSAVEVAERASDLGPLLLRAGTHPTLVLPVGLWAAILPSARARHRTHLTAVPGTGTPATPVTPATGDLDDPFGDTPAPAPTVTATPPAPAPQVGTLELDFPAPSHPTADDDPFA